MNPRPITAYPWRALEVVTRAGARRASEARRRVASVLDPARLGVALTELSGCEVSLVVRNAGVQQPRRRPLAVVGFELASSGVVCALSLEPELAVQLIAHVLRRPVTLTSTGILDDSLAGALSAIVLEAARRTGATGALHLLESSDALARAGDVFVEVSALVAGTAYQVVAALGLPESSTARSVELSSLSELSIDVPLVVGLGLAERTELADFTPGNAWFPGAGLWLGSAGDGPVALAAPSSDQGVSAMLSRDGKIVIRGESVALPYDASSALCESGRDEPMENSDKPKPSLSDAVLDSPVVVRVELGSVSLTAREWAELGPGDVIETGRRIAEPVILRIAGREVARGELVSLEGELGVRIRERVST